MPLIATKYFGEIACDEADLYEFPAGLPAFERECQFLLLNLPNRYPLVFLQSARTKDLCFIALPILVADPGYELAVPFEDLELLDLETGRQPRIGSEVLVLALLSLGGGKPASANLMAPVVINIRSRRGAQSIRRDFVYSHRHTFVQAGKSRAC